MQKEEKNDSVAPKKVFDREKVRKKNLKKKAPEGK